MTRSYLLIFCCLGEKSCTISSVTNVLHIIMKSLKMEDEDDQLAKDIKRSVKAYIEKCYKEGPHMTLLKKAAFLDPRWRHKHQEMRDVVIAELQTGTL